MRIFNLIDLESALKEDCIFKDACDKIKALTDHNPSIVDAFWNRTELEASFEIRALKTVKLVDF